VLATALTLTVGVSSGTTHAATVEHPPAQERAIEGLPAPNHAALDDVANAMLMSAARDDARQAALGAASRNAERSARAAIAQETAAGSQAPANPAATVSMVASGSPAASTVIGWAKTKIGTPYVWGGESEAEGGYDCSGLVFAAYAQIGLAMPRVADAQYLASNVHPARDKLIPGDLVFYGTSAPAIHHVGIYVGGGQMLHAPNSRSVIRFDSIDYMSDYYGATRVIS
jgi:cell wall-associated NlpC family hydrolase